eukprot:TRINITY_DN6059_c0_g5_i2.p1 TRINITY_DN6059_c0_g5~~TRINITY_DN6059_c0_g5_i2.p1  ORF type:complete len:391 (-),score=84.12 TRINITY_DN6059_c0_g5_i2:80-1204(-)
MCIRDRRRVHGGGMASNQRPDGGEQRPGIDKDLLQSITSSFLRRKDEQEALGEHMPNQGQPLVQIEQSSLPSLPSLPFLRDDPPQQQESRPRRSSSRSNSRSISVKTYPIPKETTTRTMEGWQCCQQCKKNDKNGKTCVCVVPASQRRVHIGPQGCSNCGCKGCSKEDHERRQAAGFLHGHDDRHDRHQSSEGRDDSRSRSSTPDRRRSYGCCRRCNKAFSRSGRACLCQVPNAVRKTPLPGDGCKFCGCHGCNPEDGGPAAGRREEPARRRTRFTPRAEVSSSREHSADSNDRSRSRGRSGSYTDSEEDQQSREGEPPRLKWNELNFDNLTKSPIGAMIATQFGLFPPLIGFGIPQRTPTYIFGRTVDRREFD